uniref:AlNc14C31G2851 protein n=1 Tax=Albugo laibachii Nc14 TaxID=890382 RepID=F0W7P7_9STRA|nr:AlNc14C31G2851 [Albugo laibachii Nc14]|eukprot:CCA17148.1 AlNc14C31G2851 [Albugo laibachii Nc14]
MMTTSNLKSKGLQTKDACILHIEFWRLCLSRITTIALIDHIGIRHVAFCIAFLPAPKSHFHPLANLFMISLPFHYYKCQTNFVSDGRSVERSNRSQSWTKMRRVED